MTVQHSGEVIDASETAAPTMPETGELTFREFWGVIVARRKIVLACIVAFALVALLYLHTATYRYTASLTVAATQQDNTNMLSSMSGLASIAGIDIPGSEVVSPFTLYREGLHSRQVATTLAANPELMKVAFADQWDAAAGKWREPGGIRRTLVNGAKSLMGFPRQSWQPPGPAEMEAYLQDNIAVNKDVEEAFATLTFKHPDPVFARTFLTAAHTAADEYLRARALHRTAETIQYLSTKLQAVTVAEHRAALVAALSAQERIRMNAAADTPYAAEPFGSAAASASPTTPTPPIILFFALFSGAVVGCGFALAFRFKRTEAAPEE